MNDENAFPVIRLMLRYGNVLAILVGVAVAVAGLWPAALGMGWGWGAGGVLAGLLAWFFMRMLSELIAIIADTLLPQ